jgi:hypothetical protein
VLNCPYLQDAVHVDVTKTLDLQASAILIS